MHLLQITPDQLDVKAVPEPKPTVGILAFSAVIAGLRLKRKMIKSSKV